MWMGADSCDDKAVTLEGKGFPCTASLARSWSGAPLPSVQHWPSRAPAANAAKIAGAEAACAPRAFTTVFAKWSDSALYTLAPGGSFESTATGWTLTGRAAVVAGSSPFATGKSSLSLPAGASALSGPICVEKGYPSWRFAARSTGGKLAVEVIYPRKAKESAAFTPRAAWGLTPVLRLSQGQFGYGAAYIRLRITASVATVGVDDVYVDPRYNR
jgi:hypothetical protein